jgi:parallel beta-helix repeat protein
MRLGTYSSWRKGIALKKLVSCIFLAVLTTSFFSLAINIKPVKGATITVPDDYPTIQDAIDHAFAGDTVFVRAGVYEENIHLQGKDLSFLGDNRNTILKGNLQLENWIGSISNFTILANRESPHNGINIFSTPSPLLLNNAMKSGSAVLGASDRLVYDNSFENLSYGVYVGTWYGGSSATIMNNTFKDCGTGIGTDYNGACLVANNSFIGNGYGIGDGGHCDVVGNFFFNNTIGISTGETWFFYYPSIIQDNLIFGCGKGIWLTSSSGLLFDIRGNHIIGNGYGILFGSGYASGTAFNNTIEDNEAGVVFSAIEAYSQDCWVYSNNMINNEDSVLFAANRSDSIMSWDVGYPTGGNYWTDYGGVDLQSGPFQNLTGSDGFGDTPYILNEFNQDNYPFMEKIPIALPPLPQFPLPPIAHLRYENHKLTVAQNVDFDGSASHDLDGFIVSYEWDFGDGNTTLSTGPFISHNYTAPDLYNVTLTVTDNDGLKHEITKPLTVEKMESTISIQANPQTIPIGETTTLNGTIHPNRIGANVTVWQKYQDDTAWTILVNTTTDLGSEYSYDWIPMKTGDYMIKATWPGDPYTAQNESATITLIVLNISSTISISAHRRTISEWFIIDVEGTLKDNYGNPLVNEPVILYYTFSGISNWIPITSRFTDESGSYFATWFPPSSGAFNLKAEWSGNTTYSLTCNTISILVTIPGDVNGDFFVNIQDVGLVAANWQKTVPPAPANVDINGDGRINIQDVGLLAANWQKHA